MSWFDWGIDTCYRTFTLSESNGSPVTRNEADPIGMVDQKSQRQWVQKWKKWVLAMFTSLTI